MCGHTLSTIFSRVSCVIAVPFLYRIESTSYVFPRVSVCLPRDHELDFVISLLCESSTNRSINYPGPSSLSLNVIASSTARLINYMVWAIRL